MFLNAIYAVEKTGAVCQRQQRQAVLWKCLTEVTIKRMKRSEEVIYNPSRGESIYLLP